jgi:hypothetical protein
LSTFFSRVLFKFNSVFAGHIQSQILRYSRGCMLQLTYCPSTRYVTECRPFPIRVCNQSGNSRMNSSSWWREEPNNLQNTIPYMEVQVQGVSAVHLQSGNSRLTRISLSSHRAVERAKTFFKIKLQAHTTTTTRGVSRAIHDAQSGNSRIDLSSHRSSKEPKHSSK